MASASYIHTIVSDDIENGKVWGNGKNVTLYICSIFKNDIVLGNTNVLLDDYILNVYDE